MMMRENTLSEIRGSPPSLWSDGARSSCSSSRVKLLSLLSLSVSVTSRPVTMPVRSQVIITELILLINRKCELYNCRLLCCGSNSLWIYFVVPRTLHCCSLLCQCHSFLLSLPATSVWLSSPLRLCPRSLS